MGELLDQLLLEDLREKDYDMASVIGIEAFRRLVCVYGGSNPYIPKADTIILPLRNLLIAREFDGGNTFELSRKYDLTERYIRDIVKEKAKEIRQSPMEGQTSLFYSK